jgi:hypothetical protein
MPVALCEWIWIGFKSFAVRFRTSLRITRKWKISHPYNGKFSVGQKLQIIFLSLEEKRKLWGWRRNFEDNIKMNFKVRRNYLCEDNGQWCVLVKIKTWFFFFNIWHTIIFPTDLLPGVSSGTFCMTPAHSRKTRASTAPSKQLGVQKTLSRLTCCV